VPHRPEDPRPTGAVPEGTPADDTAFARLRDADPATGKDAPVLDTAALRAEVDHRVAAAGPAASDPAASDPAALDPLAADPLAADPDRGTPAEVVPIRSRRPARWLQVAAVVAGVAVIGTGSYALGRTGGSTTADAIVLDTSGASAASSAMEMSDSADLRSSYFYGGRTVFTASGLSDQTGTARAWAFDAAATFSADTAARVAAALGVFGEPTLSWGSWTVGPTDGSGATVQIQSDGTTGVSYYDPTRDPWSCTVTEDSSSTGSTDGSTGSAEGDLGSVEPAVGTEVPTDAATLVGEPTDLVATISPDELTTMPGYAVVEPCDPAAAPAPTGDTALGMVRDTLVALGVDPGGFELTVEDSGDSTRSTAVTAAQVVDDQRTGLAWSFTLVDGGVQSLYGFLAPLVDLGEYPVVGAATAVDRLGDPRFGSTYGGVMPLLRAEAADGTADAAGSMITVDPGESAEPTVPGTVSPGAAISWPVQQVTITGARLGVSQITQSDGAALLVPAYELTGSDGSVWSVIAVAEESLDLTS
jgi:hypothetical protein